MEISAYLYEPSFYDEENKILSQEKLDEIADAISREVTEQLNKQFEAIFK